MNNVTNSSVLLVNVRMAVSRAGSIGKKQPVENGRGDYKTDWRTLLQRRPILNRTASRQIWKLDFGFTVKINLSTSLSGFEISALPGLKTCPHAPHWSPAVGTRYTLGIRRRLAIRQLNALRADEFVD